MAWQDDLIEALYYGAGGGSMPPAHYTGAATSESHTGSFSLTASDSSYEGTFPNSSGLDYVGPTRPIPAGYSGAAGDAVVYDLTTVRGAGDLTWATDVPDGALAVRFMELMTSAGPLPNEGPLSEYLGTFTDPTFLGAFGDGFAAVGPGLTPNVTIDETSGLVTVTDGGSPVGFAAFALDGSIADSGYYFIGHGGVPAPNPTTASVADLAALIESDGGLYLADRLGYAAAFLAESAPSGPTTVQWRTTTVWLEHAPPPDADPAVVTSWSYTSARPPANMSLVAHPSSLPADGSSTSTVVVLITDALGNGVESASPVFTPVAQFGAVTELGIGYYKATYTATLEEGTIPIAAISGDLGASGAIVQGRASGSINAGIGTVGIVRGG